MKYYNQNDYGSIPYPGPTAPNATIKSGGCGVCCIATVLSFFGFNESEHQPPELSKTFRNRGARVAGGTDMHKAAKIVCELGGLVCTTTSSEIELTAHLKSGGIAIANVGGNRSGYTGVFSTEGHYICVVGLSGDNYQIYDVGDYSAKYNSSYRQSKVVRSGKLLLCTPAVLHKDTENRTPNYYLFSKKNDIEDRIKELTPDKAADVVKAKVGLADATMTYLHQSYVWGDELVLKLAGAILRANRKTANTQPLATAKQTLAKNAGLADNTIYYIADCYKFGSDLVVKLAAWI